MPGPHCHSCDGLYRLAADSLTPGPYTLHIDTSRALFLDDHDPADEDNWWWHAAEIIRWADQS